MASATLTFRSGKHPTYSLFLRIKPRTGQSPGTRHWFTDGKPEISKRATTSGESSATHLLSVPQKRSSRGTSIPLTTWSCTGNLDRHWFCPLSTEFVFPLHGSSMVMHYWEVTPTMQQPQTIGMAVTLLPVKMNHKLPMLGG